METSGLRRQVQLAIRWSSASVSLRRLAMCYECAAGAYPRPRAVDLARLEALSSTLEVTT
jgi:hypothetical protein